MPYRCRDVFTATTDRLHSYRFGHKLMWTDNPVVLRRAGLQGPRLSLKVFRLLEDILRLDGFRIPLHGSWMMNRRGGDNKSSAFISLVYLFIYLFLTLYPLFLN